MCWLLRAWVQRGELVGQCENMFSRLRIDRG
jgi:hypothetical protein